MEQVNEDLFADLGDSVNELNPHLTLKLPEATKENFSIDLYLTIGRNAESHGFILLKPYNDILERGELHVIYVAEGRGRTAIAKAEELLRTYSPANLLNDLKRQCLSLQKAWGNNYHPNAQLPEYDEVSVSSLLQVCLSRESREELWRQISRVKDVPVETVAVPAWYVRYEHLSWWQLTKALEALQCVPA